MYVSPHNQSVHVAPQGAQVIIQPPLGCQPYLLNPYCSCTSHITGPCCSMPGLPRLLVCLNSLSLTCYPLAVAASLCGMAKAPKAKPSVNITVIPLQQQDSILSSRCKKSSEIESKLCQMEYGTKCHSHCFLKHLQG